MKEYLDRFLGWLEVAFNIYPALRLAVVSIGIVLITAYLTKWLL
jgi:hypothetical protein